MGLVREDDVQVVLCTCPSDEASSLARAILERRLAACVNVIPGVRSLYWWKGELVEDGESLLVIKATEDRLKMLEAALTELHPYDVPEMLSIGVQAGAEAYLSWVRESLTC